MSNVQANQLQVSIVQNQYVPDEGPKSVPVPLDFSTETVQFLDLSQLQTQQAKFSMVQTLWVDLTGFGQNLSISFTSGQTVICKADTQGFYNVMCPNPARINFTVTATSPTPLTVILLNSPVAGCVWPTV